MQVTRERPGVLALFVTLAVLKVAYIGTNLYTLWKHPSQITIAVTYTQYAFIGTWASVSRVCAFVSAVACGTSIGVDVVSVRANCVCV